MRSWQKTQTFFLGLRIGGFAIVVLLKREPRDAGMVGITCLLYCLERRFVGVAAAAGVGCPRVLVPAAAAAGRALAAVVAAATAPVAAAATATEPTFAATAAGPVDLCGSVPQGRADVVDLDLVDGALLA